MYRPKHLKEVGTKRKPPKREIPRKANNIFNVKRPPTVNSIIEEVKSWND